MLKSAAQISVPYRYTDARVLAEHFSEIHILAENPSHNTSACGLPRLRPRATPGTDSFAPRLWRAREVCRASE